MCYTVSIISTIENTFDESLVVYPNPTNGFVNIDLGANLQKIEIVVKDVSGRILKKSRLKTDSSWILNWMNQPGFILLQLYQKIRVAIIKLVKK